ncbi:ERV-F (C)1 provirus ancestral Env polyprotein [Citrus sinensis]|uniref:ERV-F (C)1 provirus ancestral Env polyprotein n=1 Tax=Citrus sinensis TaxID=2711 RepID=A0ACB8N587_CITSI|nr:ERV-F (C)1 provirus ancestral Env polyprotein [Citrus sinensis]
MRGCVFLESLPTADAEANSNNSGSSLPPVCISEDTSRFRYTYRGGLRSAIRVARVVLETVALNHSDVRWYVFGDDDTVFFPENLVKTLSKYDHGLWYYIGSNSEIFEQNRYFSFGMAFGGAGFAISSPLAKVLAKVFDSCIERYPHLYGSDSRVYSCLAELGVGLTREPGFHQVYGKHMHLPDILPVQETFKQWKKGKVLAAAYNFNTRVIHPDPCQRPTIFYLDSASSGKDGIRTHYKKSYQNCTNNMGSPRKLEEIRVLSQKLDLNIKQLMAPRRHCCDVLPSSAGQVMEIAIRECKDEELIHMHP